MGKMRVLTPEQCEKLQGRVLVFFHKCRREWKIGSIFMYNDTIPRWVMMWDEEVAELEDVGHRIVLPENPS